MNVIKRDGREELFLISKIVNAISAAAKSVEEKTNTKEMTDREVNMVAVNATDELEALNRSSIDIEEIQDVVEKKLIEFGKVNTAIAYIRYRYEHELNRKESTLMSKVLSLVDRNNEELKQENSNKNPIINSTQRDYMAGEVSKEISKKFLLPKEIWDAHEAGIIHFHDSDYFAQHIHNCCLVNLEDMLQNGTVISNTKIDKPHSFYTACNIATQIIAQVASSQYGGQTITLSHLSPFIDISRKQIEKEVEREAYIFQNGDGPKEAIPDWKKEAVVKDRLKKELSKGVQTLQYQIITLMTTNGQAPFVTVYMDINEVPEGQERDDLAMLINEVLTQRMQGVKNENGVYITPAFPKLIYALDENNVYPGSKYYHLTEKAAVCTAKRLVPDYISAKKMRELKVDKTGRGNVYPCMGCRSFLTPYVDEKGQPKYYGRFNQGVVTINLVDVACSSKGDLEKFWKIFDERLELCKDALMHRHNRLLGTPSDTAPILWQYGALARLKKGETIDKLLFNGYSTISLGYAGLAECVKYMTGKSHTEEEGKKFGLTVMQHMNDMCAKWKQESNMDFSLYGTPIESTTYKFAKKLQERFGVIPGVTDKNYITNSYHVHVTERIDAFRKLSLESEFQALSPGGAISYVEVPNMQNNIPAVMSVIQHIYENIVYAELNTKSDYCQVCHYNGEIQIVKDDSGKLVWECPNCGNRDQSKMNVARRTCGYIGTNFWNQGRTEEIAERVLHL